MGRICPILNHTLSDGVLVEDEALVNFIQKRNADFLPNELVCRSCKREITKLYNKKLRKAIELRKSSLHNSVSSLKTTKTSSSSSEYLFPHYTSAQRMQVNVLENGMDLNGNKRHCIAQHHSGTILNIPTVNLAVNEAPVQLSTSITNTHLILQENQNNQVTNNQTIPQVFGNQSNVTIRKKTIKDYLTAKVPTKAKSIPLNSQVTTITENHQQTNVTPTIQTSNANDQDDIIRRLSQEPTTSKTLKAKKRRISLVVASDTDDDEPLSLNAINGTRLPDIQPIPPKRKNHYGYTLAQDIINEYVKNISGG